MTLSFTIFASILVKQPPGLVRAKHNIGKYTDEFTRKYNSTGITPTNACGLSSILDSCMHHYLHTCRQCVLLPLTGTQINRKSSTKHIHFLNNVMAFPVFSLANDYLLSWMVTLVLLIKSVLALTIFLLQINDFLSYS